MDTIFCNPVEIASLARMKVLGEALDNKKLRHITLEGLKGSALPMLLAGYAPKKPRLIIADDPEAAGYLYYDLTQILGQESVAIFPSGYRRDIRLKSFTV